TGHMSSNSRAFSWNTVQTQTCCLQQKVEGAFLIYTLALPSGPTSKTISIKAEARLQLRSLRTRARLSIYYCSTVPSHAGERKRTSSAKDTGPATQTTQ